VKNQYKGSCLCGNVQYELVGEFQSFFLCHCSRCQKDTGSAHAANLFAQSSRLSWIKGKSSVKTYVHPNSQHAKSFCQNCGSAVPTVEDSLGFITVPAGSLDSQVLISPTARIFMGSCANWLKDFGSIPSFERLPE
jgi:hypothetical protein